MTTYSYIYALLISLGLLMCGSVEAQTLAPGEKIISIYFGGGSYFIDDEQIYDLKTFINEVDNLARYQIEVHGHTDSIGSLQFNEYLSHMRCRAVIFELLKLSIEQETIFQYDHGEQDPHYSNETWNGKLHNRRVDIILRKLAI
jgi:Outer membrane protein and related peptidoglycan-associated (lipo)proteins